MNSAVIMSKIHEQDKDATPMGTAANGNFFMLKSKCAPNTIRRALGKAYRVNLIGFGVIDKRNLYRVTETTNPARV